MNKPYEQFAFDQLSLVKPFKTQFLKWIGNKQRMAGDIISSFPQFDTYHEPFLGSGGVLGVLAPKKAYASDLFKPLMEIWECLHDDISKLIQWYTTRHQLIAEIGKKEAYEKILASYNSNPNGADFVFLSRACYGGVVRFRKKDGYMSTPCGAHQPIAPSSFAERAYEWRERTKGTTFRHMNYEEAMLEAKRGDLIYCDPPYADSQAILYGAQQFSLPHLLEVIADCKKRGIFVALSIDGSKYSGKKICDLPIPEELFEQELFLNVGRSMLKRFQMDGQSLEEHVVSDRLLLTY